MSVNMTQFTGWTPYSPNAFLYNVYSYGIGDASGGDVQDSGTGYTLIQPGDHVWIDRIFAYTTDNTGAFKFHIRAEHFSGLKTNASGQVLMMIAGVPAADWQTGDGTYYVLNRAKNICIELDARPFYLGQALQAAPIYAVYFVTNVNAKVYHFQQRLIVSRGKS